MNEATTIFFLDDSPHRVADAIGKFESTQLTWKQNASSAITSLRDIAARYPTYYDLIFLDHDLGGRTYVDPDDPNCGMAVVRALAIWHHNNQPLPSPRLWVVHSRNTEAAMMMVEAMQEIWLPVVYIPWNEMIFPASMVLDLAGAGR